MRFCFVCLLPIAAFSFGVSPADQVLLPPKLIKADGQSMWDETLNPSGYILRCLRRAIVAAVYDRRSKENAVSFSSDGHGSPLQASNPFPPIPCRLRRSPQLSSHGGAAINPFTVTMKPIL